MKLRIADIPPEGKDLKSEAAREVWFGNLLTETFKEDYPRKGPAVLELRIFNTCGNITIHGFLEVDLRPTCDRCLEVFDKILSVPIKLHLSPAVRDERDNRSHQGETDDGGTQKKDSALVEEDDQFAFYQGHVIDIGGFVREAMVLETPIQYLCSEFCKGLCPQCGRNLNLESCSCAASRGDPRFAVLKKILKN